MYICVTWAHTGVHTYACLCLQIRRPSVTLPSIFSPRGQFWGSPSLANTFLLLAMGSGKSWGPPLQLGGIFQEGRGKVGYQGLSTSPLKMASNWGLPFPLELLGTPGSKVSSKAERSWICCRLGRKGSGGP